jgi:cytidyltransferase-like protein
MTNAAAFTFGKFQQLHNGHVELFRQALENHDRLYIGISTATKNEDVGKRVCNIDRVIKANGWRGRVCVVPSGNMWAAYGDIHEVCDVVLGEDRETTGRRLAAESGADYIKVKRLTSSTEVRRRIAAGEDLTDIVPSYLVNNL